MRISVPEKALQILNALEEAGFEGYVVGGCVRDSLLGRVPNDWDITTNARPEDVKRVFSHTVDTGIAHGTVTVLWKGEAYEVTTYRIDGEYEDARHPKEVSFSKNLAEDLKRRDFTINAMAWNEKNGLVDLFDGQKDLEDGVIRCVGDAEERFSEDALRIMRCVRFAAQLGFSIEEKTRMALKNHAERLSKVSAERIRVELEKLMTSPNPGMFQILYETGQTKVFMPEFDLCMETPQNNRHHFCSVGEHTLLTVKGTPPELTLRMAALLHDIGKPATRWTDEAGEDHFTNHPEVGTEIARKILRRLRFDNRTTDRILRLVRFHDDNPPIDNEGAVRRAMARCTREGYPDLFSLKRADTKAKHPDYVGAELQYIDAYEHMAENIFSRGDPLSVKELAVSGKDLLENGMEKGPRIGEALKTALKAVLKDPKENNKEKLLKLLKNAGFFCLMLFLCAGFLTGCMNRNRKTEAETSTEEPVSETQPEETFYDGSAILTDVDTVKQCLVLTDTETGSKKTCLYTEDTIFYDKYDGYSGLAAFSPGEIVDYKLTEGGKNVSALRISSGISRIEGLKKYSVDADRGIFSFEGANYKISEDVPVFLGEENVGLKGIRDGDELKVYLKDKDVLSIRITTGFGLIILKNTDLFEGGYLNLDNSMFYQVTKGMEIEVPEGKHEITVANDGYGDSMIVNVLRNEAVAVKLDALEGEGPKFCELTITLAQPEAVVILDGEKQDVSEPLSVRYGTHKLKVELEGYDPWSKTLVANSESATIEIDLDPEGSTPSAPAPSTEAATETLTDQIIEAALNGTRPNSTNGTTVTDPTGEGVSEDDFTEAYLDTLSTMFSALSDKGDDED